MDVDESYSPSSLDYSDINDPMIVVAESLDSRKKRKLRGEESDLLPLPKHFCLEQHASLPEYSNPSSDLDYSTECFNAMDDAKTGDETTSYASVTGDSLYMVKDSSYPTGSSSSSIGSATSSIDQSCYKGNDKTQEYIEDLTYMEFICPEFAVEDLQDVVNPVESYILSSSRWSVISNQDSEEAIKKPTIDQEFEEYFLALMM